MKINKDFCNFLNVLFSHVHCILCHVLWFTHQLQTTLTSLKYKKIEWPVGCPKCFHQELNSVPMDRFHYCTGVGASKNLVFPNFVEIDPL